MFKFYGNNGSPKPIDNHKLGFSISLMCSNNTLLDDFSIKFHCISFKHMLFDGQVTVI